MLLSGRGLNPEREEPLSVSAPIGSSTLVAIPFANPTELPVELDVTITGPAPFITALSQLSNTWRLSNLSLTLSALQSGIDPSGDAAACLIGTEEEEKEEKVFSVRLSPAEGAFTRTKPAYDEMFSKPISPRAITPKLKNNGLEANEKQNSSAD